MRPPPTTSPSLRAHDRARVRLLAAAVAAALAVPGMSQRQFEPLGKRGLPLDPNGNSQATALGDVDGDGDLDLVVARFDQQTRLYRNDGSGEFTDVTTGRLPTASLSTTGLALGDVDGDGDLDLVLGNSNGDARLYRNNGTGTFADVSPAQLPAGTFSARVVVLGDVDGDLDLDLLLGNFSRQSQLLINNGSGTFADQTASRMPPLSRPVNAVVLGDVDGDGDLDAVVGTSDYFQAPQCRLLRNTGGVFADATAGNLPVTTDVTTSLALGDVDGDSDLDLVLGNARSHPYQFMVNPQDRLYLNNGTGTFVDGTAGRMPADADRTMAVALRDVDGDGDLDLATGNAGANNQQGIPIGHPNRLYRNNGAGTFTDVTAAALPPVADTTAALAFGDVDGDGDADLVVANAWFAKQNRLLLNDGLGAFADAAVPRVPALQERLVRVGHGDFDGDLDEDLLLLGSPFQLRQLRNDGRGEFTDVTAATTPALPSTPWVLAVGDVDGDSDLDVVVAGFAQACQLLRNNGAGVFTNATAGRLATPVADAAALAFLDIDGDSDLDLVVGNTVAQSRLYRNDGTGVFTDVTAAQLPAAAAQATTSLAAADFDRDGDLDLAVGVTGSFYGIGGQNRLWFNDGAGTFTDVTAGRLPVATFHTQALVSGDVDGDGDVDLVVGDTSAYYSQESVRLYLNNGTGSFSTSGGLPVVIGSTVALALADGDGDGDLDLLVGRGRNLLGGSEQDDYFVNNGSGVFGSATARTALAGNTTASVAFTDLDRDGDPEIVVARSLATNGSTLDVLSNLVRQLDAPALLRIGHTYRLDAYARFGPPHTSDLVLPVAAFGAATIVLPPFGIVGIDPGSAVTLSPIVVPQPAGVGTLPLAIPLAPWLVGLRLYTQGLHLAPPLPALLTNSITDPLGGW